MYARDRTLFLPRCSLSSTLGDAKQLKHCLYGMKDINKRDFKGGSGRTLLHEAVVNEQIECVEILLQSAALNINQTTLLGKESALHLAVQKSNRDIAFSLLYHGADPNMRNKTGRSPLHYATEKNIASLLVSFGAKTNLKDTTKQQKPVEWALERGLKQSSDLVRFLMEVEDAAEQKILSEEIRKIRQKRSKTEIVWQKESRDEEAQNSVMLKEKIKRDYLSWRTGVVTTEVVSMISKRAE